MKDFKKRLKIDKEQIELDCPNGNAMMVSNPLKWPIFTFFRENTRINVQTINSNPKSKYWSQRWTRKNERGIFNFWSRCVDIEIFSSSKRMKKNARTTKDYVNSKNMNVRHKNWVKSVKQTSSQYKIYQKIHRKFIFFKFNWSLLLIQWAEANSKWKEATFGWDRNRKIEIIGWIFQEEIRALAR